MTSILSLARKHSGYVALIFAAACAGVVLAGCGSGGGAPAAPATTLSPKSISGHTLVFTDPSLATSYTYTFGPSSYTSPSGDSGSYTYTQTAGSSTLATLQLVSVFTSSTTYNLTFTTSSSGTYTNQQSQTGTFTMQ